jgi:integrase/recombinase XerD
LLEHLVTERNFAHNTQASYRDTLLLLLPFLSKAQKQAVDRLTINDLSPSGVRAFLEYVEKERGCSGATRNLRLATIHSLAYAAPNMWLGTQEYTPCRSKKPPPLR